MILKKVFQSDSLFFLFFSTLFIFLGFLPMILQIIHAPRDKVFPLIHNSPHDYYFYMASMNQGSHGAWMLSDAFTIEPTKPSFIGSFFVILGKLGGAFGLPHPITYNVTRLIAAFFLMAAIFAFYSTIFDHQDRRLAFFFYLIAGSWLKIVSVNPFKTAVFMDWWTGIDATRRHVFLPHHLLGNALLVTSIILFLRLLKSKNVYLILPIVLSLGIASFIHTPSALAFLLATPFSFLFLFRHLQKKSLKSNLSIILGLVGIYATVIGMMFVVGSQTRLGFPWNQLTSWETAIAYPVKEELAGALGILLPFALTALIDVIRKKTPEQILLASWFFIPLFLIPFATKLSLNPIRLTQGVLFVPLAGLAVIGVNYLITKFTRDIRSIVFIIFITVITIISLPTIVHSVYYHTLEFWPQASNTYLSLSDVRTYQALAQAAPPQAVVLGSFFTSNAVPGYAYVKTYIGSYTYTLNLAEKERQTILFLRGQMSEKEAKEFLTINKIDFVITVNHDNWLYGWPGNRYKNLLESTYEEGTNGVYRVMRDKKILP